MSQVLLLFVDGLGLGPDDASINPVVQARTPFLDSLLGRKMAGIAGPIHQNGVLLIPTDATLGVDGLPQSATGQTALLTGVNAARAVGRHVTAYPTVLLKEILAEHNIFKQVQELGGRVTLANAYSPEYHGAVEEGKLRHASFTFAALSAGVKLRNLDDLRAGRAVFHDLVNARPRAWGYDIPAISPEQAGGNLARIAGDYHLTVFEFFLTDLAAHQRIDQGPADIVEMLDQFIKGIVDTLDGDRVLFMMASDHGNLEDRRARAHTRNPVPTLLIGAGREWVGGRIHTLTDITPALVGWLAEDLGHGPLTPSLSPTGRGHGV